MSRATDSVRDSAHARIRESESFDFKSRGFRGRASRGLSEIMECLRRVGVVRRRSRRKWRDQPRSPHIHPRYFVARALL